MFAVSSSRLVVRFMAQTRLVLVPPYRLGGDLTYL